MRIQKNVVLLVLIFAIIANTMANTVGRRPISSIPTGKKYIALTFDDGPNTNETVQILDELKRMGSDIKVTFYINGSQVNDQTRVVMKRASSEGHDIDNHGFYHYSHGGPHLDSKDKDGNAIVLDTKESAGENIKQNSQLIYDETGYWPFSFRAPFFEWREHLHGLDKELNMPFVQTFYDTNDWGVYNQSDPERMASDLLSSSKIVDGAIILMHDAPAGSRQGTVESLKHFIPQLIDRGFVFVTVRELFAMKQRQPEVFMYPDTWNPNNGVPFNPIEDKVRYSHVDFWPDNKDNWWLQDWWTNPVAPWDRDLTVSTVTQSKGMKDVSIAVSGISSSRLNLKVSTPGAYMITIYSVNGQLIAQQNEHLSVGENTLSMSKRLAKGLAIVSVQGIGSNMKKTMIIR